MKEKEKLRLENASNLGGIHFIDLEEKEFKDIIKNAREKLEVPIVPAMPCVRANSMHGATRSRHDDHKSTLACILEADYSKRLRLEGAPRYHEDHVAGERNNALHCYNLVQIYLDASGNEKILAAKKKQQWTNHGKKFEKISAWNLASVRNKSDVIDEAKARV